MKKKTTKTTKTKKKMADATKITDITSPGKTAPSATSRPVIVTNRPVMTNDPMVVDAKEQAVETQQVPALRSAKVIAPISPDMQAQSAAEAQNSLPDAPTAAPAEPQPAEAKETPSFSEQKETSSDIVNDIDRDSEAALTAQESKLAEAQAAREQELESMIEKGTYVVPINAVQRKRSRTFVAAMCFLSIVLLVILLDAVLDVGLFKAPFNIPHTNFFSDM